jgi:hypothetical protein
MTLEFVPSTRLAVRAAAVATAAVLVARLSFLERPYWIILTSVLLIYETAGESIKRSGQRLAMTFLGCLAGWGLFLVAAPVPGFRWTVLLGGIFLAVYFRSSQRGVVYAPMIFCASVYVVFVFAVVDSWTARLMLTRLYDTALGCVLALMGSLVVLPQHAGRQLQDDLERFWKACREYFEKAYSCLTASGAPPTSEDRQSLLKQLEQLRLRSRTSAYETFLSRDMLRRRQALVEGTEKFSRPLLAFGATVQAGLPASAVASLLGVFGAIAERTRAAFDRLDVLELLASLAPQQANQGVLERDYARALLMLDATEIDRYEFLQLGPTLYHLDEAHQALESISR